MELNTKHYLSTISVTSNDNSTSFSSREMADNITVMTILKSLIASVGIMANMTVVVVLINDRKLRVKIPNMCIINQVNINISICTLVNFVPC